MRVLHVLDHSVPLQSGYATRSSAILTGQIALGWDVAAVTGWKHEARVEGPIEVVDGIRFYRTPRRGRGPAPPIVGEVSLMRHLAARIGEVMDDFRPDLLHAHSPVLNALPALWIGGKRRVPVVYEVRAFWEDAAVEHGTAPAWGWRYRLTRRLESEALRRASAVTTICEGLRRDIVERGIPAPRVTVIPNGVDLEQFEIGGAADPGLTTRLGLEGARTLGFIGSFYSYEGLEILVEAVARLRTTNPEVRLLLVGGGPAEEALRQRTVALGLEREVLFTGRVPHHDVNAYYDVVDILVYPRIRTRLTDLVTPLKPLEAMARGRLLVASDVGGHRELIQDGETGHLFPAGDPDALANRIRALLQTPDSWDRVRRAARAYVERERAWSVIVPRYRDAYSVARS